MKKGSLAVRMLVLLSLLALAAACGGGGGGGGGATPLATGGFVKEPFKASASGWNGVFATAISTMRVQNLYSGSTGSNRLTGAGYITKIGFKADSNVVTAFTCTGVTIKMGHTSLASLTTTYANNVEQGKGSVVTVAQDKTVTIPVLSAGDYISVDLTTPFYYNGVDNLVVDYIRAGTCTGTVSLMYDNTAPFDEALQGSSITAATASLTAPINIKFTFAGGENLANYGTPSLDNAPFSTNPNWRHLQMLHTAATISGSGPITGIGMVVYSVTSAATYTVTIKVGHSILAALTTSYAGNFSDSPVTVANAVTFTVPAGVPAGSTVWLPFSGSFSYNGTDNLIVDVDVADASVNTPWAFTNIGSAQSLYGAYGSTTGGTDSASLHTKFRFNGGTMDLITPESGASYFLGTSAVSQQVLYRTTELGTGGAINKIACRANATYPARAYANTQVVMVSTNSATLSSTYADNITGGNTVFSGTLNIPAVTQGDWIEIPLSSAFSYDGTSNLVIQLSSDGGPANEWCYMGADATRWPSRTFQSGYSPVNAIYDMRFWVQK